MEDRHPLDWIERMAKSFFFRCEVILILILLGVGNTLTWHSSQLAAIATQRQLFKTASDFSGKPSDLAHVGLRPPLLHKPEIL